METRQLSNRVAVPPYCLFLHRYSLLLLYFGQINDGDDDDGD